MTFWSFFGPFFGQFWPFLAFSAVFGPVSCDILGPLSCDILGLLPATFWPFVSWGLAFVLGALWPAEARFAPGPP